MWSLHLTMNCVAQAGAKSVISQLLDRSPGLRLGVDRDDLEWHPDFFLRGSARFPWFVGADASRRGILSPGEMAEWTKALVLKTSGPLAGLVGSNPTLSAPFASLTNGVSLRPSGAGQTPPTSRSAVSLTNRA